MMASRIIQSLLGLFGRDKSPAPASAPPKRLRTNEGMVFTVEQVKRGGMGIVYICRLEHEKADKDKMTGRVALKTFDERFFFNVEMSSVVQRETAIWARIADVPFVLPLLSVFTIDGKPYLAMPAADPDEQGMVSLADRIRHAPRGLPVQSCFRVAACMAVAMRHASKLIPGVVHGDIKPDNILFLGGRPFLADFGLAGLSHERGRAGTPPYMAPELWSDEGRVTPASDLYAYGAMLFEMLTGHTPFQSPGNTDSEWAALHRSSPVPAWSGDGDAASGDGGELASHLYDLASQCLAKDVASRPEGFEAVFTSLIEWGMVYEPAVTLELMHNTVALTQFAKNEQVETAGLRIRALLDHGEIESAIEILKQIPEEKIQGDLLLTAGTTWSLGGDDTKALDYFDRFMATNPEPVEKIRCLSERGLSLKRLGRLNEARELYEQLLIQVGGQKPESQLAARANYAGVLLEMGDIDEAKRQLLWLIKRQPDSPEVRALYADALEKSGELDQAVESIQHAIARQPRNGNYHVMRAHYLMRLKRPDLALQSIDAAYDLGYHSRRWLTLAIAANMALGRRDDVEALMKAAEELPKAELDAVSKDAMEYMRALVAEEPKPSAEESEPPLASASEVSETPVDPTATEDPAAADTTEQSQEEHRQRVRSGRTPHIQTRMSMVDNSFAVDFYYDTQSPHYVDTFKRGYQQVKWHMETGQAEERQARYRFARCQHCGFLVFTARDDGERFACQACGERGPIVTERSERLDRLTIECEEALGRVFRQSEATTLLLAFWLDAGSDADADADADVAADADANKHDVIAERMREAGFVQAPPGVVAFQALYFEARKRNFNVEHPPTQVWHRPATETDDVAEGQTPRSLDLLLRRLRREVGPLNSMSMELDADRAELLLSGEDQQLQLLRGHVASHPADNELKQALVTAEISAGHLEEAKRLADEMDTASPDDPHTLVAISEIAFAENRFDEAARHLERVIAAEPRNQGARGRLVRAYKALDQHDRAAHHYREFEKLGGVASLLQRF
jgi:tetratricopeptide (TPR) repeat protein